MSHLRWLPEAVEDLKRLREFIRTHNPEAAARSAKRILEGAQKLQTFPLLGRPVQDVEGPPFRDLFIPFGQAGYWLRYAVLDDEVFVIRIWHGREDKP